MVREIVKDWDRLHDLMDDISEARNHLSDLPWEDLQGKIVSHDASYRLTDADGNDVRFPLQLVADVTFGMEKGHGRARSS